MSPLPDTISPRTLNDQALAALSAGNFAFAQERLRQAVRIDPTQPSIWLNLAGACRASGDLDGALEAVDGALRAEPRHFTALLTRASLLERRGAIKKAATAYGIALSVAPSDHRLDAETLKVVRYARTLNERHVDGLEAHLLGRVTPEARQCTPAERARIETFVGVTLGRRKNYRQQPAEFFYPGLPAIPFWDRVEFPWLAEFEAATAAISTELEGIQIGDAQRFAPYIAYPDTVPVDQWAALNHSREWSAYHLIDHGTVASEPRRLCPKTFEAIAALPQPEVFKRSPAAMFSALRPHTRIPPHTGVANTRLVVHLPLIVPEGCGFRVGDQTRFWRVGEAWIFDDTIEHEAWNDSDEVRTILICDVWNPRLSADERHLIATVMAAMDEFNEAEPTGTI